MKWVTRERPKIDRLACPWLIQRFIDPGAEILYVPPGEVIGTADRARSAASTPSSRSTVWRMPGSRGSPKS